MTQPEWAELSHFLGSAEDLPEILAELTPDPTDAIWGVLCERVYHQGDIFSASPHVLPYLLERAASWAAPGRIMPLALASSIVASSGFNGSELSETIEGLQSVALDTVTAPEISRSDRVYAISAALTFSGDVVWGAIVERLHDEEFAGVCPACRGDLWFAIGENGYYARNDFNENSSTRREPILAANTDQLPPVGLWLKSVAEQVSDRELQQRILMLFGFSVCPTCRSRVEVPAAIELFERPPK